MKRLRINGNEELHSFSDITNFLRNQSFDEENCTDELSFYDIYPASTISNDDSGRHRLKSNINNPCPNCFALHFIEERVSGSSKEDPKFNKCCLSGRVLPSLMEVETPKFLLNLIMKTNRKTFLENIRIYNGQFAFTSSLAQLDKRFTMTQGVYTFRISGNVHHFYKRNLLSEEDEEPQFAQLYIFDPQYQSRIRSERWPGLDSDIFETFTRYINSKNIFANKIPAKEKLIDDESLTIKITPDPLDKRYNLPTSDEIAAIIPDNESSQRKRSIIYYSKVPGGDQSVSRSQLRKIDQNSSLYDPLHYVLLFPNGELGWEPELRRVTSRVDCNGNPLISSRKVSQKDYYSYRCHDRLVFPHGVHIPWSGRLYHEYIVDQYDKTEQMRLLWYERHQHEIRAETYSGLQDFIEAQSFSDKVGKRIILPATFVGGPRYMHKLYLNAMAIIREFGKPSFFITFTCNPKWPDMTENIPKFLKATDRPDIVCRVFNLKVKAFIDYITKEQVFGPVISYIYSIEFQKRGLPHLHLLLTCERHVVQNGDDVDRYVCAEIPDETDKELYDTIKNYNMHTNCDACNKNEKCSKKFPHAFRDSTRFQQNSYPLYRRRNDGKFIEKNRKRFTNQHVVPYNPELSKKFDAHINVEVCATILAAKYLFKYILKGADRLRGKFENKFNELLKYVLGRYLTASDAIWRLFSFPLHGESHSVITLPVHLPDQQQVFFREGDPQSAFNAFNNGTQTKLLEWFALNSREPEARELLYFEIVKKYAWQQKEKIWTRRKRDRAVVARLVHVGAGMGELFFLRLLLTHVRGATSYKFLRTFNGIEYATFREVCTARGMLESVSFYVEVFNEGVIHVFTFKAVCDLFAGIVVHNEISDCEPFYDEVSDILYAEAMREHQEFDEEEIMHVTLYQLQRAFEDLNAESKNYGLNQCTNEVVLALMETEVHIDLNLYGTVSTTLNEAQKSFFERVVNENELLHYLDGPAGTGKTFLLKSLLAYYHRRGHKVMVVASSGIAATMYPGGQTAHKKLEIPIPADEGTDLRITPSSKTFRELEDLSLLVFDEISMISRYILETIDRSFRLLFQKPNTPFGGKRIIFAGDFRQILPVVEHGNEAQTVHATVKCSPLWRHVKTSYLIENVRAGNFTEWCNFLLGVGDGTLNNSRKEVELPSECIEAASFYDLIWKTLGMDIFNASFDGSSCILAPTNELCDYFNDIVVQMIPREYGKYTAINKNMTTDITPTEFLDNIKIGELPNTNIYLKVGAIIMCIRNLSPSLKNGTRLRIIALLQRSVRTVIITKGAHYGKEELIFPIKFIHKKRALNFSRTQLPIRISYAMTINKSQCQTLKKVGLVLNDHFQCFTDGQLYVALSRVSTGPSGIVYLKRKLRNIVFTDVLQI